MGFMKKEVRERVRAFNQILGMNHRTKPYDWSKDEEIIEAVTMAIAEFVDVSHLHASLSNLDEQFDEMIECFHPDEWVKITTGAVWDSERLEEAWETLSIASGAMQSLANATERAFRDTLALLFFEVPQNVRDHFFTVGVQFDIADVEDILADRLAEIALEMDYDGVVEHSARRYAEALEQAINNLRLKEQSTIPLGGECPF